MVRPSGIEVDVAPRMSPQPRRMLPTIEATTTDRRVEWTKPNRDNKEKIDLTPDPLLKSFIVS